MDQEIYNELKKDYKENLLSHATENGGVFPHITVFAESKNEEEDENKLSLLHIVIPEEFMENDVTKDKFVKKLVPDIFAKIKKDFIPHAVAWASEGWMRIPPKDFKPDDDYKTLPKKECLIITMESESEEEVILYEIQRNLNVDKEKGLIDKIELIELKDTPSNIGGRFSGLFKKFK